MMPPKAPLEMPVQDLACAHRDVAAPGARSGRDARLWRLAAFGPAVLSTAALLAVMWGWFEAQGFTALEAILTALIAFNFFWISLTLFTVLSGMAALARKGPRLDKRRPDALNVALLVPVHNEPPWYVLGNASAMLEELRDQGGVHRYDLFILSDTTDPAIARQEEEAVQALQATLSPGLTLYYRRRAQNTERKVGNIADWVRNWGAAYPAMLVLDADSLMTGKAIARLANALAADPAAGLIQSYPHLIGAQSVFARSQQFANGVYGMALAEGLARWSGQEGNYWGHNAILRTKAFAACAGLPHLRHWSGRDSLIMSHDFVEASLLRRAGWGVRFLPRIRGSYEETPVTLTDHIKRDRRWCQGNLQHLGLLRSKGLHAMSRFHLFHGAMGYLLSPLWFVLLVIWALIGNGEEGSVLTYFSPENPLMPTWPEMTEGRHLLILLMMYAMLLAPKVLGVLALPLTGLRYADLGGVARVAGSALTEIVLSILYAPILMVQQMIAVFRSLTGLQNGWEPQARDGGRYPLRALILAHALETFAGAALVLGLLSGLVTWWLAPIALSLACAVPLSALSGAPVTARLMGTAESFREPQIIRAARHYRAELKAYLEGRAAQNPAE